MSSFHPLAIPLTSPTMSQVRFKQFAGFLVLLIIAASMYYWMIPDRNWQGVKVITGKTDSIVLPDGSKAILIGPSELGYPKTFEEKIRKVKMEGEVYFDIVPSLTKTFLIQSEIGGVETSGAKLLMNTTENKQFILHCVEGEARMIARGKKEILEITLSKNEMCDFIRGDGKLEKKAFDVATLHEIKHFSNSVSTPIHSAQKSTK